VALLGWLCGGLVLAALGAALAEGEGPAGHLKALQPQFWELVPKDARIEKLAGDFKFTEGPIWHPDGYLLFSDIPANQIKKWIPSGGVATFREPSGNSNGLTLDRQRRLIACEHSNRRVSRTEADGKVTVLAERYEGKRLNSPNDVVVRSDGAIYFTDPPYGIRPEEAELGFNGVYRLSSDGKLTLLIKDFDRPNGLAFSPDEKRLYIDDSQRQHIRVFDVAPDGSLTNGRLFADMKSDGDGVPDGMKVDARGNVYCTGAGGVWVFDPKGAHLGTIQPPEVPANCGWGGHDGQTLYITARTGLYRVHLKVAGAGR